MRKITILLLCLTLLATTLSSALAADLGFTPGMDTLKDQDACMAAFPIALRMAINSDDEQQKEQLIDYLSLKPGTYGLANPYMAIVNAGYVILMMGSNSDDNDQWSTAATLNLIAVSNIIGDESGRIGFWFMTTINEMAQTRKAGDSFYRSYRNDGWEIEWSADDDLTKITFLNWPGFSFR